MGHRTDYLDNGKRGERDGGEARRPQEGQNGHSGVERRAESGAAGAGVVYPPDLGVPGWRGVPRAGSLLLVG